MSNTDVDTSGKRKSHKGKRKDGDGKRAKAKAATVECAEQSDRNQEPPLSPTLQPSSIIDIEKQSNPQVASRDTRETMEAGSTLPHSPAWFAAAVAGAEKLSNTAVNAQSLGEDQEVVIIKLPPSTNPRSLHGKSISIPETSCAPTEVHGTRLQATREQNQCSKGLYVIGVHNGKTSAVPVSATVALHLGLEEVEGCEDAIDEALLREVSEVISKGTVDVNDGVKDEAGGDAKAKKKHKKRKHRDSDVGVKARTESTEVAHTQETETAGKKKRKRSDSEAREAGHGEEAEAAPKKKKKKKKQVAVE